jgi:mono/diheme cytochrome c family protein
MRAKRVLRALTLTAAAAASVAASGAGYLLLRQPASARPLSLKVEMTPERIARGKYIFTLADCNGCHSARDFSRFGGPVIPGHAGEGVEFPKEMGLPGRIASRNITTDVETGIGAWTDGEKIRAIREGISRDGTMLFPMMPYEHYRNMSDEDAMSLVAYLNTLPPVRHKVERSQIDFPASVLVKSAPKPVRAVPATDRGDRLAWGRYLVSVAGCIECHSESEKGAPKAGLEFAGGKAFHFPGVVVVSANITPDPQTGIGRWREQDFLDKFQQYREYAENGAPPAGPENFTVMPWLEFSQLDANDLGAIYTFLRNQKPVYHIVDSHPGVPKMMTQK